MQIRHKYVLKITFKFMLSIMIEISFAGYLSVPAYPSTLCSVILGLGVEQWTSDAPLPPGLAADFCQ